MAVRCATRILRCCSVCCFAIFDESEEAAASRTSRGRKTIKFGAQEREAPRSDTRNDGETGGFELARLDSASWKGMPKELGSPKDDGNTSASRKNSSQRWEKRYSQAHNRHYFENLHTGLTSWDHPTGDGVTVEDEFVSAEWTRHYSTDAQRYYYSNADGNTTWEIP